MICTSATISLSTVVDTQEKGRRGPAASEGDSRHPDDRTRQRGGAAVGPGGRWGDRRLAAHVRSGVAVPRARAGPRLRGPIGARHTAWAGGRRRILRRLRRGGATLAADGAHRGARGIRGSRGPAVAHLPAAPPERRLGVYGARRRRTGDPSWSIDLPGTQPAGVGPSDARRIDGGAARRAHARRAVRRTGCGGPRLPTAGRGRSAGDVRAPAGRSRGCEAGAPRGARRLVRVRFLLPRGRFTVAERRDPRDLRAGDRCSADHPRCRARRHDG